MSKGGYGPAGDPSRPISTRTRELRWRGQQACFWATAGVAIGLLPAFAPRAGAADALHSGAPLARAGTPVAGTPATFREFDPTRRDAALEQRLAALAARAPGQLSVAVLNLDTGAHARVHAGVPRPAWSVLKLPLAAAVVARVREGSAHWSDSVRVNASTMSPTGSPLTDGHPGGGTWTLATLLDTMLVASDNSAADALLAEVGGPAAVTAWLRAQDLDGIRVDRNERQLGDDCHGVPANLPAARDARQVGTRRERCPPSRRAAAARRFSADPRDRASAQALVRLLARLARGEMVGVEGWRRLYEPMARCTTGPGRLRSGFPPACAVVNRSGTGFAWRGIYSGVNDVGIVRLPGGGGRVVIAVLMADARGPLPLAEATLADVARCVFDAWNAPD